ncbi:MAG: hypothetical protein ACOYK8_07815 [Alphaproteobacteria bacterium]
MGIGLEGIIGGLQQIFNSRGGLSQPIAEQNQAPRGTSFAPDALQPEDLLVYLPVRLHDYAKKELAAIESSEALAHVATALHYRCVTELYFSGREKGFLPNNSPARFRDNLPSSTGDEQVFGFCSDSFIPRTTFEFFLQPENKQYFFTAATLAHGVNENIKEQFGTAMNIRFYVTQANDTENSAVKQEKLQKADQILTQKFPELTAQDLKKHRNIAVVTTTMLHCVLIETEEKDLPKAHRSLCTALDDVKKLGNTVEMDAPSNQQSLVKPKRSQGLGL